MIEFNEEQLIEVVLLAAKRGYRQASADVRKKIEKAAEGMAWSRVDAHRRELLSMLNARVEELEKNRASDLLIAGFREAIELVEFGVGRKPHSQDKDARERGEKY